MIKIKRAWKSSTVELIASVTMPDGDSWDFTFMHSCSSSWVASLLENQLRRSLQGADGKLLEAGRYEGRSQGAREARKEIRGLLKEKDDLMSALTDAAKKLATANERLALVSAPPEKKLLTEKPPDPPDAPPPPQSGAVTVLPPPKEFTRRGWADAHVKKLEQQGLKARVEPREGGWRVTVIG